MSGTFPSKQAVLTSPERWQRWQQRGLDEDARFMRGVGRWALGAGVVAAVFILAVLFR